jgi:amino acid transporter
MVMIALCYGELAARSSTAGVEFLYALQTLGPLAGFLVGWFLTLYAVAVCAFEAISLSWLLRALVPSISLDTAYTIVGSPVTWDALIIGSTGALAIGTLHYRGASTAIGFQNIVTFGFIAISIILISLGLVLGSAENLKPLLGAPSGHSWIVGSFWIFSTCAFFLNGWQASLHAIEERRADVSARSAIFHIVAAILASTVFYCGIVLAAASLVPWPSLIGKELPAAAAFRTVGAEGLLGSAVIVTAAVSLSKTWSAMVWVASRVVFAQARHGFLPPPLAAVDSKTGAPRTAVMFVTMLTLAGVALGRGAIVPIVNMVSICLALSIILCLLVLLRRRRDGSAAPSFTVPGGQFVIICALAGAIAMVGIAVLEPLLSGAGKIPLEWTLLAAWAVIGSAIWMSTKGLRRTRAA